MMQSHDMAGMGGNTTCVTEVRHGHLRNSELEKQRTNANITKMLWNWRVHDSCFLSSSWHVTSNSTMAVSCIGAALLVVCLEFLRRVSHEYDAFILRQFQRQLYAQQPALASAASNCCDGLTSTFGVQQATFRATALQQLVRSILHGITLGIAYIVMLLIMTFNGFVFISVILGAILGKFLCDWFVVRMPDSREEQKEERHSSISPTGPTGCCA
jgi:copper transporter 1